MRQLRTYKLPLAILQKEIEQQNEDHEEGVDFDKHLWTNREVLKYVKDIHADGYSLDEPVLDYKVWELTMVPVKKLSDPEYYDQDDPWRRVIDLDWDHIRHISRNDIMSKPITIYPKHGIGWVLDGNHRVAAARAAGIKHIPAFVPKK